MKQVLDTTSPQMFVSFITDTQKTEVWCSSKEAPKKKESAEHAFAWNNSKIQFEEVKTSEEVTLAHGITLPPVPKTKSKAKVSTFGNVEWWDKPFDPQVSFGVLKNELVPDSIKNGQIIVLGKKATAFFGEAQKNGVRGHEFTAMRSEYYAAVAQALLDIDKSKEAAYYLGIALKLQPDNPTAVAIKAKLKQ